MVLLFELRKDLESAADMVNQIESGSQSTRQHHRAPVRTTCVSGWLFFVLLSRKLPLISIRN